MRTWKLKVDDPLSLSLATDARLGPTDYCNDHIWELSLGGGEPPALALQTTFGLRARNLRMFPRFSEGENTLNDPEAFHTPPVVQAIYPNYLRLVCAPFGDIDVTIEWWVPSSQSVAGRISVRNASGAARQIRLEWAAVLTPAEDGTRMAAVEMGGGSVLVGQTGGLSPVVFLTGGPQAGVGPYPSLALTIELPAGTTRRFVWTEAALQETSTGGLPSASFTVTRQLAARNWDAEIARLEMFNNGLLEIYTGNPDWDVAFALSQKVAFGLLQTPLEGKLPYPSFVFTRQPDQGYSPRGDGSDYNHLWNGQTPLESLYLVDFLLPAAPELAQGLLYNFLATHTEGGFIDWKPGLGGQRSQVWATPLLATLAERIYRSTGDRQFLHKVYPHLLSFIQAWFTPLHDRDADGVPEWDHPMQTSFEENPLFSPWLDWLQGAAITTAESPDLCAWLYQECRALIRIAGVLQITQPLQSLQAFADNLKSAIEASWSEEAACYHYWDRDTHLSLPGEKLGERRGAGEIVVNRQFDAPVRPLVRLETGGEAARSGVELFIHGTGASGQHRVEHISSESIRWVHSWQAHLTTAILTGERVYTRIEKIDIQGIGEEDRCRLSTVGYTDLDQTLLLPLWAGIPGPERARLLVEKTITDPQRFWQPFGVRTCAQPPPSLSTDSSALAAESVSLPWNTLIGEGLLAYGYRAETAELVTRLMNAILQNLKQHSAFRKLYHAQSGLGMGERNSVDGLAPLGLFFAALGVRIISPRKVFLEGFNPFPWPITIKYRGLALLLHADRSTVIFPDGQTVTITDPAPQLVALE